MAERAYTVQEIDALRKCCEDKYTWGRYSGPPRSSGGGVVWGRSYKEKDMIFAVEQMVRTHMLAGHTAQDLMSADDR